VKRKPFDDVRVRQAFALALDKEDIVEKITRAGEPVANTLVPPGSAGYTPPQGLVYNVAEARRLLAEAGYPNGQGFPDVTLLYPMRGGFWIQLATEMQALWRRDLGITSIHLRGQEWRVYLNTQQLMDYDFDVSDWIGDYGDPQTFLDMFVTDGGNNQTGWAIRSMTRCWRRRKIRPILRSGCKFSRTWKRYWSMTRRRLFRFIFGWGFRFTIPTSSAAWSRILSMSISGANFIFRGEEMSTFNNVAAVYDRRGTVNTLSHFIGGHRPPLQTELILRQAQDDGIRRVRFTR